MYLTELYPTELYVIKLFTITLSQNSMNYEKYTAIGSEDKPQYLKRLAMVILGQYFHSTSTDPV